LTKLRELIAAEIARRDNSINMQPAFVFVIHDRPGALSDVEAAVEAIIEQHERDDNRPMVCVTRAIADQVADALERKFPKRTIICHPITSPSDSMRKRGLLKPEPNVGPGRDRDATTRAADRISALRGSD
jgi:hypothetical protein